MSFLPKALLCAALLLIVVAPNIEGRRAKRTIKRSPLRPTKVLYNTGRPYACTVNITSSEASCSGILVNASWVITAAHCVSEADPSDVVVFCDSSDYENDVVEIVVHEEWLNIKRLPYDIAMLKLEKKSKLPPIPIADASTNVSEGSLFVVQTHYANITVRKTSDADLVNRKVCNSRFHWTNSVAETTFCAIAPSCVSDAGSAMLFDPIGQGSTVLYGIASYETKQCQRHGFPIVYTSVVHHYSWIRSILDGKTDTSADSKKKNKVENITKKHETKNETEILNAALAAIKKDDSTTLSILLDLGLSPDASVGKYNRSLLHKCAEYDAYDCANVLVTYGADVRIKEDRVAAEPLHFAALSGAISVANVLLEANAYVNAKDKRKNTALHYVVTSDDGKLSMILFLLESGANVHEVDDDKATPLHHAAAANWVSATKVLLQAGANVIVYAKDQGTPLHWAGRAGANDAIKVLLPVTDIEAKSRKGLEETAFLFAVRHGAPLSTIRILVEEGGANVNVYDIKGQTPLHRAVQNGDVEVIKFLIKYGANTKRANIYDRRAIDIYCDLHDCDDPTNAGIRKALQA